MKKGLLMLLLLVLAVPLRAQKTTGDSLRNVWNDKTRPDSVRMKAVNELVTTVIKFNIDSAATLCAGFLAFAHAANNGEMEGKALRLMAQILESKGKPIAALTLLDSSLALAKRTGDKRSLAMTYNSMGNALSIMNKASLAIEQYLESLKIYEELDDIAALEKTYRNIGIQFSQIKNYGKAEEYYKKGFAIVTKNKLNASIPAYMNSLGNFYRDAKKYDEALHYYREVLTWQDSAINQKLVAAALHNIGLTYWEGLNNLDSATVYFNKAVIKKETIGWMTALNSTYLGLGGVYASGGKYREALVWCRKAYNDAQKTAQPLSEMNSCGCLYRAYKGLHQLDSALKYHEFVETLKDSLVNIDREKETNVKELGYEFGKKALTDSLTFAGKEMVLTEQGKKQRIGLAGAAVGLILLIVLAVVIYSGKKRSDGLLLNILPAETARELKKKGRTEARQFEEVTVLFTDFKNFTQTAEQLSPAELVELINFCYSAFDRIISKHNIEKIKTIGDSYMCVAGLPVVNKTHATDGVRAALEIVAFIQTYNDGRRQQGLPFFDIRVGLHTGPVVAGVVGIKKFAYDIWGDTVNIASRMESSGETGKINISETTYALVKEDFVCVHRGKIEAKNKGKIDMYFVEGAQGALRE